VATEEVLLIRQLKIESALLTLAPSYKDTPALLGHYAWHLASLDANVSVQKYNVENAPDLCPSLLAVLNAGGDMRNYKQASRSATKKELKRIERAAQEFLIAIAEAHAPAIKLCDLHQDANGQTVRLARDVMIAAHYADVDDVPVVAGRGRPVRPKAAAIALETARIYMAVAEKLPTITTTLESKATGPFMGLLAVVFDALGVTDSVESQAKAAVKFIRGSMENNAAPVS
jgi:hypothetical protein